MTPDAPLNARELRVKLGLSHATFYRRLQENPRAFDAFKVTRPVGQRIYSSVQVHLYLAGQSTARLGRKAS